MTEQAKGERCRSCGYRGWCAPGRACCTGCDHRQLPNSRETVAECPSCKRWFQEPQYSMHRIQHKQPTPPPAHEPANAERWVCGHTDDEHSAPGPAKGGEARVEYAEGMMYPWRVIQGLEEDGETPNCVASLREKSVAEFVTGLINERDQLRKANGAKINTEHERICPYRAERDELAVTLEMIVDALNSGIHQHACSYCGHMTEGGRPETQAEIRAHMDQCTKHPMNQLRKANEALREGMRDLANGVLRIGWDRTADHVHEQAVQVIAQLDSDAERGD
jgi:hypothetical protein